MKPYCRLDPNTSGYGLPSNLKTGKFCTNHNSKERNMFIAERFLSGVVRYYGIHPVSTDGGWVHMACKFLKLKHHIHFIS